MAGDAALEPCREEANEAPTIALAKSFAVIFPRGLREDVPGVCGDTLVFGEALVLLLGGTGIGCDAFCEVWPGCVGMTGSA